MAFKSLLDPDFRYRSAANTDVRETFERIRRERHVSPQPPRGADGEDTGVTWLPEALASRSSRTQR